MNAAAPDNEMDAAVDDAIRTCLDSVPPTSFFLYAGAGSGKTRSLVDALRHIVEAHGKRLALQRKQIAVITYTNAACDEIKQRLEFNSLVDVRTIHSFAWDLVQGYNDDIRQWLSTNLLSEIAELELEQAKGRRASKASEDRARLIAAKQERLAHLPKIKKFVYSPTSDNRTRESLNHAEVIGMTAKMLVDKPGLQRLLIARFPILLIDESQDTNKALMESVLAVQALHKSSFCVGLFGDTMQRIYADGKTDLAESIPSDWEKPVKRMNHRCPSRVVELINKIRADADGQAQFWRSDSITGHVRLFILPDSTGDRASAEARAREVMADVSGDEMWSQPDSVKTLTLEHHMAARRFGFHNFFEPLYAVKSWRTALLDGSLPALRLFTQDILPAVDALSRKDRYRLTAHVRARSPLLTKDALHAAGSAQLQSVKRARDAVESMGELFDGADQPKLIDVLQCIARTGLFPIPEVLLPFSVHEDDGAIDPLNTERESPSEVDEQLNAWRAALQVGIGEVAKYDRYIRGETEFDTHQGVKGLEFPRVMVVISDEEARGFLFSYDKLLGAKAATKADASNETVGRETSMDRTRRLLYVTCSRAEEGLAVVCYTTNPDAVRNFALEKAWFSDGEILTGE